MSCIVFESFHSQDNLDLSIRICQLKTQDGCFKLKKNVTKQQLIAHGQKLQNGHKVMIHCETLEIYCTLCKKQLPDLPQQTQKRYRLTEIVQKQKKTRSIDPLFFRQLLIAPKEGEAQIFAGNSQYPPSFQKQKRGLCGLKVNALNSYINSVVHLLSYVPSIRQFFKMASLSKIDNLLIHHLCQTINIIWSGRFRIYSIDSLVKMIQDNFGLYSSKVPQNLIYYILRNLLEEFSFDQLPCIQGQLIKEEYYQWKSQSGRCYNMVKQIFGGDCTIQKICGNCQTISMSHVKFQCLKVSYEGNHDQLFKGQLYRLIQQALNWRKNLEGEADIKKMICPNCGSKYRDIQNYVILPNNLFLQLGDQLTGLNVQLPDQIDLVKFTKNYAKKKESTQMAIYQYVGCIFRKEKRFVTHVRDFASKKQYQFSDENILEHTKPINNIKMAVYRRKIDGKNNALLKNIRSCLQVGLNPVVPLPDFWSVYLQQNSSVPPLMNPFICHHGKIKNTLQLSKMQKGVQKVPIEIYQYLLEKFGGRVITIDKQDDFCRQCQDTLNAINQIKASQKQLAAFADKLSHKKEWTYINRNWLEKWKRFVYEQQKIGYKMFGFPRPGEIDNRIGIQEPNNTTHKKIAPEVWCFLHKFYGGGPRFGSPSYHPSGVVVTSVSLRFQSLRDNFVCLYGNQVSKSSEYNQQKIEELDEQQQSIN